MYRMILILTFIFLCNSVAYGEWSNQDTAYQITYLGVNAADFITTLPVTKGDGYELNPMFGRNPSVLRLSGTFIATTILHFYIAKVLPDSVRPYWYLTTIGTKWSMAEHNYAVDDRRPIPPWTVMITSNW